MGKHLDYDKKVKKEFGIDEAVDMEPVFFLAHVRTQRQEIQKFLIRERTELFLGEAQATDKNPVIADKGRSMITEKRTSIPQLVRTIKVLNELEAELEAEVGTDTTSDFDTA